MKLPQKIIDANVILRFFLADDEEKFLKAKEFIRRLEFGEDTDFKKLKINFSEP
jgi:predicted nucleic acid-binding protein